MKKFYAVVEIVDKPFGAEPPSALLPSQNPVAITIGLKQVVATYNTREGAEGAAYSLSHKSLKTFVVMEALTSFARPSNIERVEL